MIEHISTLIAGDATQSRLERALYALAFMEQAGGAPVVSQLNAHPLLHDHPAEQALVQASPSRDVKQAPQVIIPLLLAVERIVVSITGPMYHRLCAWYRLLRVWATMRFDDHRGLIPSRMRCPTTH